MQVPLNKPVICPDLIGRITDLAALHLLIDSAKGGQGQVALLSGEAGIGKSRLVREAKAYASTQGFLVVQGNCFPSDRSYPYAPLLDLLRTLLADSDKSTISAYLKPFARDLHQVLPEVISLAPGIISMQPLTPFEPEQEKRRIFTALLQCFISMATQQPLLMIIEDLHWSDDTSLEFLHALARRSTAHPLMLLMTYRNDEIHPVLRSWLAQLDRERLAQEFLLTSLPRNDVESMLQAIFDMQRRVPSETLDALFGLTEGNPFFIEEVLKSLITAGGIFYTDEIWEHKPLSDLHIPRSIQDAVQQRTTQLSEDARHVLMLAAVAGRRFDFALLQKLMHHDEQQLLALMKELIAAQLVVEESAERFAFRHALTRQAIYTQLLARERKGLHRTIAETMESLFASAFDTYLEDLSYHFYEASVWEKALKYAQSAGIKAQSLYSPHAAIDHYSRALSALYNLAMTPPPALFCARGQVYEILGEFEHARADYETSLQLARSNGDGKAEWEAQLNLGMLWTVRDYERSGEYYQHAFELARTMNEPSTLAHSLNRLGNWHLNLERPLDALQHHQEALNIFQQLHNQHGIAETLDLLGMTSYLGGDLVQGTTYYKQAIELFRKLDDRQGLTSSLATLTLRGATYQTDTMVSAAKSLAEVIPDGELALKIAREIDQLSAEAYTLIFLGFCLGAQGDYTRALESAREGLEIAEEIEHQQWMTAAHCALGATYRDLLELSIAQKHLEQALALANETCSVHWIRTASGYLASTHVLQGQFLRAEAILHSAIDDHTPTQTLGQRLAWCARAELALAQGQPGIALQIADQLIASAANFSDNRNIPRISKLRGEALMLLDKRTEAESELAAAKECAYDQGMKSLLWRIYVTLGKLYQIQGRPDESERAYSNSRTIIEELAINISDEHLREHFQHLATSILPRTRSLSPGRVAKQAFEGLTAREREVAALIAQGKINREIAGELVVSVRTVETHVANIMLKLSFDSRRQIAAWASERKLIPNE